jgi:hypothetical protein
MLTEKEQKSATVFNCEPCDFLCSKKSNYAKHLLTRKHKTLTGKEQKVPAYRCSYCEKEYKSREGLWYHKKKCIPPPPFGSTIQGPGENEVKFLTNLVLEIVKTNNDLQKQNQELQQQVIEVYKKTQAQTITSSNSIVSNSHNKTFNMQFFLNEQCKDAMNIMDFVDSMTLDFADLEDVGKLGYVEGISNIIIRKLNEMDIYKRPIHCSDAKREIMFVKDDNIWEKENGNYDRLRKAIKHITKKNGDLMIPWSKENPSCMDIQHKMNDVYLQIMSQSMGGRESFVESENKIMKKIAKAVLINK